MKMEEGFLLANYYLDKIEVDSSVCWWLEKLTIENGYSDKTIKQIKSESKQLGFDCRELSELYSSIAYFVYPRLCAFAATVKEGNAGCPMGLTVESWYEIIQQIIFPFEEILTGNMDNGKTPDGLTVNEYYEKLHTGTKLFGEYFLHLWI